MLLLRLVCFDGAHKFRCVLLQVHEDQLPRHAQCHQRVQKTRRGQARDVFVTVDAIHGRGHRRIVGGRPARYSDEEVPAGVRREQGSWRARLS